VTDDDNVVRIDFARKTIVGADGAERPIRSDDGPKPAAGDKALVPPDESKLACFSRLVDEGLVLVTLDARVPGVQVPKRFAGALQFHLNFSHRFRVPDFAYDDLGVRATLGFDTGDFKCVVPWNAVYAMSSQVLNERRVFPESFPQELLAVLPALAAAAEDDEPGS